MYCQENKPMDANANVGANPNAPPQLVADLPNSHCRKGLHIAIAFLVPVNSVLSVFIIKYVPDEARYTVAFFTTCVLLCIQIPCPEMFRWLDVACHPKVMSWIPVIVISAAGAVYPACLHLSKLHWVVIAGWVMLAIHVLTSALQYYDYLSWKRFGHKSVHPLPPTTEENV